MKQVQGREPMVRIDVDQVGHALICRCRARLRAGLSVHTKSCSAAKSNLGSETLHPCASSSRAYFLIITS